MRRASVLIVILLAALMLVACGKDEPLVGDAQAPSPSSTQTTQTTVTKATQPARTTATTATTATTTTATTTTATTPTTPVPPRSEDDGCTPVAQPAPSSASRRKPQRRLDPNRVYFAVVKTNCGTFTIRLASGRAPKTAASFAALARSRFFDGLTFHRIAKPGGNDFVIQGGDPLGTGNGGPGYSVVEAPPRGTRYARYVAAMAKTQTERPGTSGSQFFVVTAPEAPLPPEYALLGEVTEGKGVIDRIAALAADPTTEMPVDPVVMSSVRIESQPR